MSYLFIWLNGTHQLLIYVDDINKLGGSLHTTMKNTETLVVDSNEIGIEANADKTKYMVKSRDQNAGRSQNVTNDYSSFEEDERFQIFWNNFNT
jgi:hypothetical protein